MKRISQTSKIATFIILLAVGLIILSLKQYEQIETTSYAENTIQVTCYNCNGSRRVVCPQCGGSGIELDVGQNVTLSQIQFVYITCSVCSGKGDIMCAICQGEGTIRIRKR